MSEKRLWSAKDDFDGSSGLAVGTAFGPEIGCRLELVGSISSYYVFGRLNPRIA